MRGHENFGFYDKEGIFEVKFVSSMDCLSESHVHIVRKVDEVVIVANMSVERKNDGNKTGLTR